MPEPAQSSPSLQAVAVELYKCNRCGFCQTRCPLYRVTGKESLVARGHLAHLQAVLNGDLPLEGAIREPLFSCLMCRACTAECPPAIETDRVIVAARADYVGRRQPALQRLLFRRLLGSPRMLRAAARTLTRLSRTRLTVFAKLLPLLPGVDQGYAEAPAMLPTPSAFLRDRLAARPAPSCSGDRVTYFPGCGIDYALPEVGSATLDLLEALGCAVDVPENVCCGLPPYSYGDMESARALARRNIRLLSAGGEGPIIADCASCSSFLKDYPRLFSDDDPDRAAAQKLADRVRDVSEFLAEADLRHRLQPLRAVVTYHDPCHLSRYQKIVRQPRDLLRQIPGVEYRELPEADWCCGSAGTYGMSHHDLSMRILRRKMENIRSTGAEFVATACPACIMQLRYGARRFGVQVQVVHLTELLRRALPEREPVT